MTESYIKEITEKEFARGVKNTYTKEGSKANEMCC